MTYVIIVDLFEKTQETCSKKHEASQISPAKISNFFGNFDWREPSQPLSKTDKEVTHKVADILHRFKNEIWNLNLKWRSCFEPVKHKNWAWKLWKQRRFRVESVVIDTNSLNENQGNLSVQSMKTIQVELRIFEGGMKTNQADLSRYNIKTSTFMRT